MPSFLKFFGSTLFILQSQKNSACYVMVVFWDNFLGNPDFKAKDIYLLLSRFW